MVSSIFSSLYELVTGNNPDYPEFREQIFDSVGLFTVMMSLVVAVAFYAVLGRWKMVWYNLTHWTITLVVCAVMGFVFAYLLTKSELGLVDGYVIRFSIFNTVYAALFFFLFSLIGRYVSIFSRHTPF